MDARIAAAHVLDLASGVASDPLAPVSCGELKDPVRVMSLWRSRPRKCIDRRDIAVEESVNEPPFKTVNSRLTDYRSPGTREFACPHPIDAGHR